MIERKQIPKVAAGAAVVFVVFAMVTLNRDSNAQHAKALGPALAYLTAQPEVAWMEIDKNGRSVYLGLHGRTEDTRGMIHAAAVNGSLASLSRVHVWAVPASARGWRPGDAGLVCDATADGRVDGGACDGLAMLPKWQ